MSGKILFIVLFLFGLVLPTGGQASVPSCQSNADCAAGAFCEKAVGDCDGVGQCLVRPGICPQVFDPVCGCDGDTYSNGCEAAASGVSVAHEGACQPAVSQHFKCYDAKGALDAPQTVSLEDQFDFTEETVEKAKLLCNPVDKNGEGMGDPNSHLVCFKIEKKPSVGKDVEVTNQFGTQQLKVKGPKFLCVPSTKVVIDNE